MSMAACLQCKVFFDPTVGRSAFETVGIFLCDKCLLDRPSLVNMPPGQQISIAGQSGTIVSSDRQGDGWTYTVNYGVTYYTPRTELEMIQLAEEKLKHESTPTAVIGYRGWWVDWTSGKIFGIFWKDSVWNTGPIVQASCAIGNGSHICANPFHNHELHQHDEDNPIPALNGPCGLWAFHDPHKAVAYTVRSEQQREKEDPRDSREDRAEVLVHGVIEGGGRLIYAQAGWRSAKAMIVAMYIPHHPHSEEIQQAVLARHPHVKFYDDYLQMMADHPPTRPSVAEQWNRPASKAPSEVHLILRSHQIIRQLARNEQQQRQYQPRRNPASQGGGLPQFQFIGPTWSQSHRTYPWWLVFISGMLPRFRKRVRVWQAKRKAASTTTERG